MESENFSKQPTNNDQKERKEKINDNNNYRNLIIGIGSTLGFFLVKFCLDIFFRK